MHAGVPWQPCSSASSRSSRMSSMPLRSSCRAPPGLAISASQLRPPPTRNPDSGRDQGPRRNFSTQQHPGSQAPGRRLRDAADQLRSVWQRIKPQRVKQDPATGICLAPDTPGQLGQPVRLLTNHLAISQFRAAARYRVTISPKAPPASAPAAASGSKPSAAVIPFDVRQQLLAQVAQQQGWADDSWLYDPSSNRLFSLQELAVGSAVEAAAGQGRKGGASTFMVSITQKATAAAQPTTSGSVDDPDTLQQLSMVLKASLQAALLPQGAVETARAMLLPAGSSSSVTQPTGAAGGGRGGRSSRGGRGGGRSPARGGGGSSQGGVLQWWTGVRYGIKPGQQSCTVQLDTTSGAVLPAGRLADLVCAAAGVASPAALCKDKKLLAAAEQDVKGAKASVDHRPGVRVNVWGLDSRTPQQFKFKLKDGGRETTVADYFRSTYPAMRFSHLHDWPCVMTSQSGAAVPLELCSIAKPQPRRTLTDRQTADLIKLAALPPEQRMRALMQLVQQTFSNWRLPLLQTWGMTISPQLLRVAGRVLPDAQLQYATDTCAEAANTGQWRAPAGAGMLQPPKLKQWAVLNLATQRHSSTDVQQFVTELTAQLKQQGGAAAAPTIIDGSRHSSTQAAVQATAAAAAAAGGGGGSKAQLLLVVLPSDNSKQYGEVKAAAAQLGVATQCMVAYAAGIGSNIKRPYVANLLLKVAAKAGGVAWQLPQGPEIWAPALAAAKGGLMVLGIDVGHGIAGGGGSKPSMAGIVGTLDACCSRFGAVVQEQTPGHEIVLGLQGGLVQLLRDRQKGAGQLPGSLLVYRDGVSDSQYLAVLQQEVPAVRAACREVGGEAYNPKVTLVVVSKSHGTRLFPDPADPNSSDGRSGNIKPGTVVDTGIVAPLKYEYFLNSHAGIQGTNRPGRYNVLVDDSSLGPDGLQLITQHLASTYAACTRTISCPAAVRYADKVAGASWAAAAGAGSVSWTVLQPASPGVKALQFRTLGISRDMAGLMWFV